MVNIKAIEKSVLQYTVALEVALRDDGDATIDDDDASIDDDDAMIDDDDATIDDGDATIDDGDAIIYQLSTELDSLWNTELERRASVWKRALTWRAKVCPGAIGEHVEAVLRGVLQGGARPAGRIVRCRAQCGVWALASSLASPSSIVASSSSIDASSSSIVASPSSHRHSRVARPSRATVPIGEVFCHCHDSPSFGIHCKLAITVDCGPPPVFLNGTVSYQNTTSEAHYRCDDGFTLEGETTAVCRVDGRWSSTPVCRPRTGSMVKCLRYIDKIPRTARN